MKELMINAHKLAKTFTGNYIACLKLAMIILWKKKKENKDLRKVVSGMTRTKKAPIKKEKSIDEIRTEMFKKFPRLADDDCVETIGHIIARVETAIEIAYEEGWDYYDSICDTEKEWKAEVKKAEMFLKKYKKFAKLEPYV